jgi:hypothetical protein
MWRINRPIESGVDDSVARSTIAVSKGALFGYVGTKATEDCGFVAVSGQQVADATPLESYRGIYESFVTNMTTIAQICAGGASRVSSASGSIR